MYLHFEYMESDFLLCCLWNLVIWFCVAETESFFLLNIMWFEEGKQVPEKFFRTVRFRHIRWDDSVLLDSGKDWLGEEQLWSFSIWRVHSCHVKRKQYFEKGEAYNYVNNDKNNEIMKNIMHNCLLFEEDKYSILPGNFHACMCVIFIQHLHVYGPYNPYTYHPDLIGHRLLSWLITIILLHGFVIQFP